LLAQEPNTGIFLRCCGAPAEWSGDDEKHRASIQAIMEDWAQLGEPTLLAACPTCIKKFREYMPSIPVLSVYEALDEREDAKGAARASGVWTVFDPCSARHKENLKKAVRSLAKTAGLTLEPMPMQDDTARCCGFGGQPAVANPKYAKFVTERRIAESALPYVTYCINCRDVFAEAGKETKHILEILFPPADAPRNAPRKQPTVTEQRSNRIYLKRNLLKTYWGEEMKPNEPIYAFEIIIDDDLKAKISNQKILESEVFEVVDFLLRSGRTVKNEETGIHSGYKQVGRMTCWVDYKETNRPGQFRLVNVYTHRMSIDLENMWNGLRPEDYLRGGSNPGEGDSNG
jgi:hypothetical protein